MSTTNTRSLTGAARTVRGFTLVELLVTISIALFLLGGLVTIVQSVRRTYVDQQALVTLQDQQRFAITLLTDVIQSGGYYDNPTASTSITAFPAWGVFGAAGEAFYGVQGAALPGTGDTIYVQYRTAENDGIINCGGGSNTTIAPDALYTNEFYVNASQQLVCVLFVNGVAQAPVPLVNGVANLAIYYGVKREIPATDYNVDTYEQATAAALDFPNANVSSVRVIVTFVNPLWGTPNQPVNTPQYITVERVIEVMSRGGDYT